MEYLRTYAREDGNEIGIGCVCPGCGHAYLDGSTAFCGHCGHDLAGNPGLDLADARPVLFRSGVKHARILRGFSGEPQEMVYLDLPGAGPDEDGSFHANTDRFMLFRDDHGTIRREGCPLGLDDTMMCEGRPGMGCGDLIGWIGYELNGEHVACGALCRGNVSFD